jgi:ATP-binding cassette subfamily B (MDR/TAP) protein 1
MKYMGILVAIAFVVNFISSSALQIAHDRIGNRLRNAYFSALVKQEIGFFDVTPSGKILTNITDDITLIQTTYTEKIIKCCEFTSQAAIGIVLAFINSWQLTYVDSCCCCSFYCLTTIYID